MAGERARYKREEYALSGHVVVEDRKVSKCSGIMEKMNGTLEDEFNIIHPTIQVECEEQCPATPDDSCNEGRSPGRWCG